MGQRKHVNKISTEWLKTAGYLGTSEQDQINYIFVSPRKKTENKIPGDTGHFIRTEIDDTDFKNENLVTKKKKNKKDRTRTPTLPTTTTTTAIIIIIILMEH